MGTESTQQRHRVLPDVSEKLPRIAVSRRCFTAWLTLHGLVHFDYLKVGLYRTYAAGMTSTFLPKLVGGGQAAKIAHDLQVFLNRGTLYT